jgi:hypothetical protein
LGIVTHASSVFLTILALSGCATSFEPTTSGPGTTFGKIYIDTPEVYSRERLVNDRFQQDTWLRDKLGEQPTQGLQGSTGTSSQTNTSLGLAIAMPSGVKPETPVTSPKPPTLPTAQLEKSTASKETVDTPIEQLRDAMAYREEVRNEILENQLDDRHDIAGNTLYRLKFDATVVPQRDTSAYAMVEVTFTGSSFWNVSGSDLERRTATIGQESKREWEARTGIMLPDWEFANYVPGLDQATIDFYTRAYTNWVRDIDSTKYSLEDMLYGPLQGYFAVNEDGGPLEITEKEQCESYKRGTQRDAALKELISRGVPSEYLFAPVIEIEEGNGEVSMDTTIKLLCVQTGLANFISDLRGHTNPIYTYAVTPKERVQRIHGNTLSAGMAGVSIGAEQPGFGASLAHSNAREARANAIMRQPQLVGYSPKAHRPGEATMGWLIGPRYKISDDSNGVVSFRHVPSQHTLTGIISVPSWWTELNLVTRTYWLDENGVEFTEEGNVLSPGMDTGTGKVSVITLPGDLTSIVDILDPKRREPRLDPSTTKPGELRACEPGSVIIRGSQLWRSTVVTLGTQQANSISVLPNMEGIIATFDTVRPSISGSELLYLWTSEGEEKVRAIQVVGECKTSPAGASTT